MNLLNGSRILLCVTGGIAAYKSAELARLFIMEGAEVRAAMTKSAAEFVRPLTFQALTGKRVLLDLFDMEREGQIGHIEAARWADAVVMAPATANSIGKLANGIADDTVSTVLAAFRGPVVLAPAMNWAMWRNEFVQENIQRLSTIERFSVVPPETGDLACGEQGQGRLAALETILDATLYACREEKDLSGERVLVTAGPTFEDIDPVRYVANRSSGRMGFAIAREAMARGAETVLVAGPNTLTPPFGVAYEEVRTADQMHKRVMEHARDANVIVMSAAVADYRPVRTADQKIHKQDSSFALNLTRTVDILKELGKARKPRQFLVGFAAETNQVLQSGRKKLTEKKLDAIVINDVSQEGAGFEVETNVVKIIGKSGLIESLPQMAKSEVSVQLFEIIQKLRAAPVSTRSASRRGRTRGKRGGSAAKSDNTASAKSTTENAAENAGKTASKAANTAPAKAEGKAPAKRDAAPSDDKAAEK